MIYHLARAVRPAADRPALRRAGQHAGPGHAGPAGGARADQVHPVRRLGGRRRRWPAASTFALGKAFCYYYRAVHQGHVPRPEDLRRYYQEQLALAEKAWQKLRSRRPQDGRHAMSRWRIAVVAVLIVLPFAVPGRRWASYFLWQQRLALLRLVAAWPPAWPWATCSAWYWQRKQQLLRPLDFDAAAALDRPRPRRPGSSSRPGPRPPRSSTAEQLERRPTSTSRPPRRWPRSWPAFYHPRRRDPLGHADHARDPGRRRAGRPRPGRAGRSATCPAATC